MKFQDIDDLIFENSDTVISQKWLYHCLMRPRPVTSPEKRRVDSNMERYPRGYKGLPC